MFRRNLNDDIGQAFVELALVLPLFILLLVGVAELGRLAYAAIEVNNAARAGVAYAARNHTTASDTGAAGGIVTAAKAEAPDITDIGATATLSCACENNATGVIATNPSCGSSDTNTTKCASPSRIVEIVQVNTTARVNTLFHLPGIPNQVMFHGQAIMRVAQ